MVAVSATYNNRNLLYKLSHLRVSLIDWLELCLMVQMSLIFCFLFSSSVVCITGCSYIVPSDCCFLFCSLNSTTVSCTYYDLLKYAYGRQTAFCFIFLQFFFYSERLDQDNSGILTTICNHSFHCSCISRWTDSSCPVGDFNFLLHYLRCDMSMVVFVL